MAQATIDPAVCDAKFAMAQSKGSLRPLLILSDIDIRVAHDDPYLRKCCAILDMGVASGTMDLALLSPLSLHHGIITRIDSFSSSLEISVPKVGVRGMCPIFIAKCHWGCPKISLWVFSLSLANGRGASRRTRRMQVGLCARYLGHKAASGTIQRPSDNKCSGPCTASSRGA